MNMNYTDILNKAHLAAQAAVKDKKDDGACGMAWVVSTDRKLNAWCKKQLPIMTIAGRHDHVTYGDKHHPSGWQFYKPGNFRGQAVLAHEAGADAFCQVLRQELGPEHFYVGSRLD